MAAINLTGLNTLKLDVQAGRTGGNLKFTLHNTTGAGYDIEITPNIITAGQFQTITWDISGVADANKNNITTFKTTIVDATAPNTFYVDNFKMVGYAKSFTDDAFTISENFNRGTMRSISDVMSISEVFGRGLGKTLTDTTALTDFIQRGITRAWAELVTLTEIAARNISWVITESISLTDSLSKGIGRGFTENIYLSDILKNTLLWLRGSHLVTTWQKANKVLTTWVRSIKPLNIWNRKN